VLHVLRRLNLAGTVSSERARVLDRFQDTSFARYPHSPLRERIWKLRNNLTAYDAAYVALAEALDAPLITLNARLAQAPGIRTAVEVYG
jgi:predicted nucleic acid-binding protein